MANDFIVTDDLVVFGRASIGDGGRTTSGNILGDLEICNTSGVQIKIISDSTSISSIDFATNPTTGTAIGSLSFNHNSPQKFELIINETPQITVTGAGVTITGDFTVQGTTTTINSTEVAIADRTFLLNKDEVGPGVSTPFVSGIEVERGPISDNAGWFFNEMKNWWGPIGVTQSLGNVNEINTTTAGNLLTITGTGAIIVPTGTTGEQPAPTNGSIRYNTNTNTLDFVISGAWKSLDPTGTNSDFVAVVGDTMTGDLVMNGGQILIDQAISTISDPALAFRGDGNTGVHWPGANQISLVADGTERFAIDASGNATSTGDNFTLAGTGALQLHDGLTGQRPTPSNGMIRYNTTNNVFEGHVGGIWKDFGTVTTGGGFVEKAGDTMTGDLNMAADILPDSTANLRDVGSSSKKFQTMYAVTFNGTATAALYADLAERYTSDMLLDVGTVVIFGGEAEITECFEEEDTAVAGVISGKPGIMMNCKAGENDTNPYVALKGMVPCKVVGPVKKGELIVTSNIRGHGKSAGKKAEPYTAFARALENREAGPIELGTMMVSII